MRKYYNTPCSIYRKWTATVRWSQVQTTTPTYPDIKCSIWSKSKSYNPTTQAVQTDSNWYTVNLEALYNDVLIWDIMLINGNQYKVSNNPVPHEKANGTIDNYEIFVTLTTSVTL